MFLCLKSVSKIVIDSFGAHIIRPGSVGQVLPPVLMCGRSNTPHRTHNWSALPAIPVSLTLDNYYQGHI